MGNHFSFFGCLLWLDFSTQQKECQMNPSAHDAEIWRYDNPLPVVAYATVTRVFGEPGSLSIQAGYEIDITRVTFNGREIQTTDAERAEITEQIAKHIT